jgi:MFS transporter, DHA1 family, multidrug resistance protein
MISGAEMQTKGLYILFASMFIVMSGYGLTLTVLPFYIERMALGGGATSKEISVHVGALTGVFALMQFFFAPLWGAMSDKIGRRPLFFAGLGGNAVFNVLFGLGSDLVTLYVARILSGIFSSAILPTATAYVADASSDSDRGKSMAWLGAATGLGVVAGPVLGAWLSRRSWHLAFHFGIFSVDGFSMPFFAAALLAFVGLIAAVYMLPESLRPVRVAEFEPRTKLTSKLGKLLRNGSFWKLLYLSFLSYFSLALFEGTFALHAQQVMKFGPAQMGMVFIVCGLVMAVGQGAIVGWFIDYKKEILLLAIGSGMVGVALILLMLTETMTFILIWVGVLAFGMALLIPTLATLASRRSETEVGTALGLQSAANSLGQFAGPVTGGFLFVWSIHIPYLSTAVPLLATAIFLGTKVFLERGRQDGPHFD